VTSTGGTASSRGGTRYVAAHCIRIGKRFALWISPVFTSRTAQARSPAIPSAPTSARSSRSPAIDLTGKRQTSRTRPMIIAPDYHPFVLLPKSR
jgi:hypothetical protein